MDDLAGLLLGEVVVGIADVPGQEAQRAGRDARLERQHLQRRDEAVAAERGHVPRDAGVRDHALRRLGEQQVQVAPRARHPHREQVVVAAYLGGVAVEPVHHGAAAAQRLTVANRPRRRPRRAGRCHGDRELHAGPRQQQEVHGDSHKHKGVDAERASSGRES